MTRPRRTRRDERGTALVEVTWLAVLLLVPLVYVVLAVFEVQRAAFALSAATRAAGRAYTLAPSPGEGAARARAAAAVALEDQGVTMAGGSLRVGCDSGCLTPGSVVRVRMTQRVDLPLMPDALGADTPSIRLTADHTVPYGTFREDRS